MSRIPSVLRYAAIAGDVLFVLWVTRNGINEGFRGTRVEMASYIALMVLLVLNAVLLWRAEREGRA